MGDEFKVSRRPIAPGMEDYVGVPLSVLDHGFVRVVDYMGNDEAIVQAARTSYGQGTPTRRKDRDLIRYLMRHRHTSPFEMCEVKFHVKLPIFVARQWIRHRMANVNEISARYSVLDREFYAPTLDQLAVQATDSKQGRGAALSPATAAGILECLVRDAQRSFDTYDENLNVGLARELARIGLPLSTYTQWFWKTDLHNLFHFLGLRAERHAQQEIRVYADAMLQITKAWVPEATEAFEDYRYNAFTLSAQMLAVVKRAMTGELVMFESTGLSRREWEELKATFDLEVA